ncbi:MAG: hypothetical protein HQL40_07025 [Alphaproteobacteria bacterium]|nr:hypothetical protein [Alphaproteobacteria bacterium]
MIRSGDPDGSDESEYASDDEVADALRALNEADYEALMRSARVRAMGMVGQSGEDLLNTAIERLLEGERRWRRGAPLLAVIRGILRSLSMDWWRREDLVRISLEADLALADGERPGVITGAVDPSPGVERQLIAKQEMESLREAFGEDEIAWEIVLALAGGESPQEIRYAYELTQTQYDSALKRIWRLKRKLTGGDGT